MATNETWGPGGIDPAKPNGNRVESVPVADDPSLGNRDAIEQAARQALATNRTYVALASPSAAQTAAEVKALARQNNGVIRLLLGLLDGTD